MAIEALPNAVAAPSRLGELPGGGVDGRGKAQGDAFAQLLAQPAAVSGQQPAALGLMMQTAPLQAGGQTGIGEDIFGSLRKFGQTIGRMEEMGGYRPRSAQAGNVQAGQAPATSARQPSAVLPGPAEQDPRAGRRAQSGEDHINKAMEMAQDALGHQAQLYKVMMDFTLVHSSAESLNKSLKTLLTQGGG